MVLVSCELNKLHTAYILHIHKHLPWGSEKLTIGGGSAHSWAQTKFFLRRFEINTDFWKSAQINDYSENNNPKLIYYYANYTVVWGLSVIAKKVSLPKGFLVLSSYSYRTGTQVYVLLLCTYQLTLLILRSGNYSLRDRSLTMLTRRGR